MITILCSFFSALVARLFAAEIYASISAIADWILRLYTKALPEQMGERLLEEWRYDLYDTPGNLTKLLKALNIGRTVLFARDDIGVLEKNNEAKAIKIAHPAMSRISISISKEEAEKLRLLTENFQNFEALEASYNEWKMYKENLSSESATED